MIDHRVDSIFQLQDFTFDIYGDLFREVAVCHGSRHLCDVTNLARQVTGHEVDVVGQILPGSGNALNLCLTAEFSFRTHFTRHACYFRGKGVELVNHRVDGIFQFQNLASNVYSNLLREVAVCHGSRYLCDVAYLAGQIARHEVDVVGQVLPRSGNACHLRLPAEFPFRSHFTSNTRYLRSKGAKLIDHRVDGVLEFQDFTLHIDGDLL